MVNRRTSILSFIFGDGKQKDEHPVIYLPEGKQKDDLISQKKLKKNQKILKS
jgi:hypothetical protein